MSGIGDRDLRLFVAVAEELSFTRAAARLHMAQPPLSRAIRDLERRLGADLFRRDTRRVALTEYGAGLLDEARDVLDALDRFDRQARRAARATATLVVTAKPGIATGMLHRILDAYATLPGALPIEVDVSGYRAQADMVRDGRADLALISSPYDDRNLDCVHLTVDPRVAALSVEHPLARRSTLRCRDLDGEPVPTWPEETPAERAYWAGRDGDPDRPGMGQHRPAAPAVSDPTQLLEVVGLGQAVALIPAPLAERNPRPDVAYRPVSDASPYIVAAAWAAGSRSRPVADLVRVATEVYTADAIRHE